MLFFLFSLSLFSSLSSTLLLFFPTLYLPFSLYLVFSFLPLFFLKPQSFPLQFYLFNFLSYFFHQFFHFFSLFFLFFLHHPQLFYNLFYSIIQIQSPSYLFYFLPYFLSLSCSNFPQYPFDLSFLLLFLRLEHMSCVYPTFSVRPMSSSRIIFRSEAILLVLKAGFFVPQAGC